MQCEPCVRMYQHALAASTFLLFAVLGVPILGNEPPAESVLDDTLQQVGAVFSVAGESEFSGEGGDHVEVEHSDVFALSEGTIAFRFSADKVIGRSGLFSKDYTGNRDGGDLTAWITDGRIEVRLQSAKHEVTLRSAKGSIHVGEDYHLAVTFGPDGFWIYVNGVMTAWRPDFTQGMKRNVQNLSLGANNWGRNESNPTGTWDPFDGRINDFKIYGTQFRAVDIAAVAGVEPEPIPTEPFFEEGVLFGTDADELLEADAFDDEVMELRGGYGDDKIVGTSEDDILQGDHGEDLVMGGEGNDLLISFADGREPKIAQEYGSEDDPYKEIDPNTRTYYPDQPIEADDGFIGGPGADLFQFRVLINAKRHIILKHVNDDGTINWGRNGVAGENDNVHDHWVETLGNEVIWDFSRAEGDHIEIVGHTVEVYNRVHEDSDGDGILDSTVLHVRSNQGSGGGAHNLDLLGTIRIFGDLVMESDYTVEQEDYGIVPTINELEEAITPRKFTSVSDDGTPPPMPVVEDGDLPDGAVFGVLNELVFDGLEEDYIEVEHDERFELAEGTIALRFIAEDVVATHALFSKDYTGNRDGGDLSVWIQHRQVRVRLQSMTDSISAETYEGSVEPGKQYHLAVTFGPDGLWVYLNGELSAWAPLSQQGLEMNKVNMAIGASTWSRDESRPYRTGDYFAGVISEFMIFGVQFDDDAVAELAGIPVEPIPTEPFVEGGLLYGTDADELLRGGNYEVMEVHGGYGDDRVVGTSENDILQGDHGEDRLVGRAGDDLLISFADGREPRIAQEYGPEDDPYNEINPDTRTYYPDQPIEADDVFIGGPGADIFHFRVLINAKRHIILKHVNDDGTINWGRNGVAGENDNVHDHWVETLGNEVIWDFSRAEGDHIEIVGHTVEVYNRVHEDSDGDGILDSTVLHVRSNQGSGGGAHNLDLLGTIRVFGDLVMESDYTVEQEDYGIVPTINELEEAITPRKFTSVADDGTPPPTPVVKDGDLPDGAVFGVLNELVFDGLEEDYIEVEHDERFELAEGTIALRFIAEDVVATHALFSKDYTGNRDGGDLSVWIQHRQVRVRLQSMTDSISAETYEGSVEPGKQYHLAVTFGPDGLWVYLNGELSAWASLSQQGLEMNKVNMAIGASTWSRDESRPYRTGDYFAGVISEFMIFGVQFDDDAVAELAGIPVEPVPTEPFVQDGLLYGTDADELLEAGAYEVMEVHGGYGNDELVGTSEDDILQGDHGEDLVKGGEGNDLLISFADGREPKIAQEYGPEDDPYNEINPDTRTYYPDQPIEADDGFIGGPGADLFHFRVLINAKRHIILKHVNDDGTINWGRNGVAGENDNVHDHWVETLGDEVIWDFSRAEGDHIEVVGHTVEVYHRVYEDSDGDGILDSTVLHVRSNQGSGGGAHNLDLLGTIRVFGDLVMESDYTVEQEDYGIVPTINELEEAITPRKFTSVADDGTPPPTPVVKDGDLPDGAVFGVLNELVFDGLEEDYIEVEHDERFELAEGTIALRFIAEDVVATHALFSKDYTGNRDGGDLSVWIQHRQIRVRLQSMTDSISAETYEGSVEPGKQYHLAVTFGPDGLWVYLNGKISAWAPSSQQGLEMNKVNMAIGASTWSRDESRPYRTGDYFAGVISEFMIFGVQFDDDAVSELAGIPVEPVPTEPFVEDGLLYGTDADELLEADAFDDEVMEVHGGYGDDEIVGTPEDDILQGGHGEDLVMGGEGNDLLISFADGREPKIAQEYGPEDDPYNEINPDTRTYYPDQPIEADDGFIGGPGADLFHFRVLINAKRHIILKHVNDDGTINWGRNGVAGENDNVHDHWVETLGDEVIWDFSREEGDHIEVVGHTVEVYNRVHEDSDGDGILDSTVLHVRSNQGSGGGAHNLDLLGTIRIFGDLVMESDYTVEQEDYGIVPTVNELEEAITPRKFTSVADDGTPPPMPVADDGDLPEGAVFGVLSELLFDGFEEDYLEVEHDERFELAEGTIALRFMAEDVVARYALFSKDYTGNRDGGDLTVLIQHGRVQVRFQNVTDSIWVKTDEGSVEAGKVYHLAVTFGPAGLAIYLNGEISASDSSFQQGLEMNKVNMAIGASTWSRDEAKPYRTGDHFSGVISEFMIFGFQFDDDAALTLATSPVAKEAPLPGTDGDGIHNIMAPVRGLAIRNGP